MDLLQGVHDMQEEAEMIQGEGEVPNIDNMPLPSIEQLLKALDGMTGMSEEEKQELREQLLNPQQLGLNNRGFESSNQFFILISLLLIVALIFVFFGYKLYKSLIDKERKRQEKKKQKQMKKRK